MSNSNHQAQVLSFARPATAQRELDLAIVEVGVSACQPVWATASKGLVKTVGSAQPVWATASKGVFKTVGAAQPVWATASSGSFKSLVSIAA